MLRRVNSTSSGPEWCEARNKHGLRLEREPLLAAFENFLDHVERLIGLVAHADQKRTLGGLSLRPQILGEALVGQFDDRVGRRQDRLRRAVILLERHDIGARAEMTGKVEDVAHRRRAKRIDRLGVVADDGQPLAVGPQRQQHRGLELVGVLIFVDQDMIEARGDFTGDRGLLHHVRPIEQEIVVVEHVLLLLDLDILREQSPQLVLPHLAPRKARAENRVERLFAIHGARIDGEACAFGWKAFLGFGETEIVADEVHQVGRILAIVDGEGGHEPDRFGIFAQQPRANGVERSGPR